MSPGISSWLAEIIARTTGDAISGPLQVRAIGGGSINDTYHVVTGDGRQWFYKINEVRRFPDLFIREKQGLAALSAAEVIRTPKVMACEDIDQRQVLILEYIDQGARTRGFWETFGQQLAALHRRTAPVFGAGDESVPLQNYMGSLQQSNTPAGSWVDFFRDQRLRPQIALAEAKGLLTKANIAQFEKLYEKLEEIFPPEPPALLHGDLWNGNFLCDRQEQPVLIDPAVYYGHRSMDLAMTTLFGGFSSGFYDAYHASYPFPPHHTLQWEVCNLYPLLIHLNLFGPDLRGGDPASTFPDRNPGSAQLYLSNILHTIQSF